MTDSRVEWYPGTQISTSIHSTGGRIYVSTRTFEYLAVPLNYQYQYRFQQVNKSLLFQIVAISTYCTYQHQN